MTFPTTPGQSLTAASVTSSAASGQGSTQAVGATVGTTSTHSAVFAVTNFTPGATQNAALILVIEGNLDGSTWVTLAEDTVEANGTYVLVPTIGSAAARIPMANLRTSAYFKGFGSGSPTATVSAWVGTTV